MVTVNSSCYPNYPRGWEGNGPAPEPAQHDDDLAALDRSSPPLTVARALREHCHIPFETFFLAAHLGGGKFAYFQGPRPLSEEEIRVVFKRERFITYSNTSRSREDFSQTHDDAYGFDAAYSARTAQHFEDQWPMESRRRKRPRRHARRDQDDEAPPIIASSKKAIEIGDSSAVLEFYDRGFKAIQQTACKEVAKAFIKVICPKKQANFPYRKGSEAAPDWWPEPWGPGEKDMTRHVEPDHLWKRERVHILKHILRLIIDPETQPPSIRRLGHITVAMLETAAMDSLSIWFQDASKPKNAKKRPILKELFKVARMEEKYKRNEIDGTTQVFVQADDMMNYCFDEDEPDDDMEEAAEAAAKHDRTHSVTSSQVSPARTTAMPVLPSLSPASSTVHALSAQFQATQFLHEMPMRANQYGGPTMDLSPDQYGYHDGLPSQASLQAHPTASLQMHDMLTASPHHHHHDTSRRSSMFTPTTDFAGHSPSAMYHSPWSQSQSPQSQGTPSTSASSPETSSPMFAYAPAHHAHQHQHQQHAAALPSLPLPMPMAQHHHQHQHQPGNPYAGQYSPHDIAAQNHVHHHHHQQQQPQQQQHHVFRAGSIQLSLQNHPGAAGGYGQGQGQGYEHDTRGHE